MRIRLAFAVKVPYTAPQTGAVRRTDPTQEPFMDHLPSVKLTRDCEGVQVPQGTQATLPQGTEVQIAQTLGGTFTVHAPGGMFRIANRDADALGLEPESARPSAPSQPQGEVTEDQVWQVLRSCFDPEIPVNIVDLGLIYSMDLTRNESGTSKVDVRMTLTAPGCGMGGVIAKDAQEKLLMLEGMEEATVEIVWDPPWHQSMITPEGRRILQLD
jgi:probable FeS assembly SUF system protein SufT